MLWKRPSLRDARALLTRRLRVRGWTWSLSMVWVAAGVVVTGYLFYATTHPYISADIPGTMLIGWAVGPAAVQISAVLAMVAWLALPVPVGIAGLIKLRSWRLVNWPRAGAWAAAWFAGAVLFALARSWADSPGLSWGLLTLCAAWPLLGILMTLILAGPTRGREDPVTNSGERGKLPAPA